MFRARAEIRPWPSTQREGACLSGSRDPGKLFVMNASDGSIIQSLNIVNTSDDITVDPVHRHLYITGTTGLDVVDPVGPDQYPVRKHLDTLGGKTSVYIPSLQRLYVVRTKGPDAAIAGLQVFSVR